MIDTFTPLGVAAAGALKKIDERRKFTIAKTRSGLDVETHTITSREQWLEMRRADVTASTIAAVCGCDPYKTALQLYAEKTGAVHVSHAETPIMRRGRLFEDVVINCLREERPKWNIWKPDVYLRSPKHRIGCTPDAYAIDEDGKRGIIQAKVVSKPVFDEQWQDGAPINYQLQTLTEAMLADADWAVIAVVVVSTFGFEFEMVPVWRHPGAEEKIISSVDAFWDDVANGREPRADLSRDAKLVAMLYAPDEKAPPVDLSADNELPELLSEFETKAAKKLALSSEIKPLEERLGEIKTAFLTKLAGASVGRLSDGTEIHTKTISRNGYEVKPTSYVQVKIKHEERV